MLIHADFICLSANTSLQTNLLLKPAHADGFTAGMILVIFVFLPYKLHDKVS